MNIDELIKKLQEIKQEIGNVEVRTGTTKVWNDNLMVDNISSVSYDSFFEPDINIFVNKDNNARLVI